MTCDDTEAARHTRSLGNTNKAVPAQGTDAEERSLDTYDRIFSVIDGGLTTGEGAAW